MYIHTFHLVPSLCTLCQTVLMVSTSDENTDLVWPLRYMYVFTKHIGLYTAYMCDEHSDL